MTYKLILRLLKKGVRFGIFLVVLSPNLVNACSLKSPEDFNNFFNSFSTNKEFASTRTLYPYVWRLETEEKTKETVITKNGDAKYPPLAASAEKNGLILKVESSTQEKSVVKMYAPNTGWSFRFYFLNNDGCWFMQSAHEVSM